MLTIVSGQPVPESTYTVQEGGEYEDGELVVCIDNQGLEAAFQAYYITNGCCKGEQ